jgi:adenylosuccinate lyase
MKQSSSSPLLNLSPIDGRYKKDTEELSNYFSEFAYIKYRVLVEIEYLRAISNYKLIRKFSKKEILFMENSITSFSIKDANKIKDFEKATQHDIKAIEYFLNDKFKKTTLNDVSHFIHFGLTSEDINNIALRLMLRDANENIVLPQIKELNNEIFIRTKNYKKIKMLARTHGQSAVPTSLGKELLVFCERLSNELKILNKTTFRAKLNGAVGNYNALYFAYPKVNWEKFTKDFLKSLRFNTFLYTTQIAPYEDVIYYFQTIQRINGIILDLNQDMWRYISDDYFTQINKKGEIGSSTMPQKINPINFENSEGNIIIANSLVDGFTNKLPISRLQRDLSGSTISRNFGITLAHSLLAYKNTLKGLAKIIPNTEILEKDLNEDWSILMEAVQIYLKKEGIKNGYEIVTSLSRGNKLNKDDYQNLINNLPINKNQKLILINLTPEKYSGISF